MISDSLIHYYKDPLAATGLGFVLYLSGKLCFHLLRAFRAFFFSRIFSLSVNPASLGSWAVVTGSTDGIGKAFAFALAKRGMNIVLISRSIDRLTATAKDIESAFTVKTKCVAVDFTGDVEIYKGIERELHGLDIGVLVNNVGMASDDYPEIFHLVSDLEQTYRNILHVNTFPVTFLTAAILPRLLNKGKGAVINVGSVASYLGYFIAVYGATKSYVDALSRNLQQEYAGKGIIVQSLITHGVESKMSKQPASFLTPTPTAYADAALCTLGLEAVTPGCFPHWLIMFGLQSLPEWMMNAMYRWAIHSIPKGKDRVFFPKRD